MDVIKPEKYWVQDRCYRRNPTKNDYSIYLKESTPIVAENRKSSEYSETNPYEEMEDSMGCDPEALDEEESLEYSIEETSAGFKASCTSISSRFFPIIIGAKGSTRKRLENETGVKIIIPGRNEKGPIVVQGKRKKDVLFAVRRLDMLCSQTRLKWDPTHFLCFPLNQVGVVGKFVEFKEAVLELLGSSADESIFQAPEKFHITITVLVLLDGAERDEAIKVLDNLRAEIRQIVGSGNIRVNIKGLDIMNDDPSDAHVLYAKVNTPDDTLQRLTNFIDKQYQSTGYAKRTRGTQVKLHATLINTRYRSSATQEDANRRKSRQSFDARQILQKFRDFDFGTIEVNEIRLSTIYTTAEDGFYKTISTAVI